MGKTTFAKEIVNEFEQHSWEIIRFELREAKDIDTAYLLILFTLGPNEILRSSPGMLENTVAKRKRERNLILTCLRQKCNKTQNILLVFDNIESELIERYKEELFCFFDAIINTEACKIDILKFVLTSRIDFKLPMSIINHCLEPLPSSTSKNFMCRTRKFALQSDEEKALAKITEFCRNIPYLIEGAEHIMRNGCITSKELLQKIETHIDNGVPEQYVTIKTLFESIPTENLRILAVKLCVFPRPFSSSDAKEVAELKSDYDTSLDLEYLRNNQVIRSETVDGETKHEVRTLFKEFTETYLRVEILVYQNSYNEAKVKFGHHFGNKFLNLADTLDKDFVASFEEIQKDKLSFDCMLKLSVHDNKILEHGVHFLHRESICRVAIFLEALMNIEERKTLFKAWADVLEEKGHLLLSAYMRGWESIQLPGTGGTAPPERILHHAEECFDQVAHKTDVDQFNGVKGFLLYCKGKLYREECVCLTSKKYPQKKNNLLKKALQQCEGALEIYTNLHNGRAHNVTVRILTCMGHCYMDLDRPATAEIYYRQALEMKLKLTEGNERHNEIPTFYNQLSQVYQKRGDFEETEKTIIDRVFGRLSQDAKTHYERAVSYMKKAIELNKELDLDDTLSNATFNRNLANIFIALKRYDEALECAEKSHEVRNKLLGQHPETVRILYLMGVINEMRKSHRAVLLNYEEAFKMGQSLPEENHSMLKDLVCNRLEVVSSASHPGSGEDAFHVKNGLLIVIVMNAFNNDTPGRGGSMQDVQALLNTFCGCLKFTGKLIHNKTEQEILDKLEKIARDECDKYDCCVVCIMSHGELNSFYDVNGNKIEENTITSILKKFFHGKPKLLFLQACRTHPDQQTVRRNTRYNDACKSSGPANHAVLRDSEMLIGYSCCEGMKAYRGAVSCSFYLQILSKVLREKYSDTDILSILTEVNKRVQEQMTEKTDRIQVCPFTSTLSKKVYFHAPIGK